MLLVRFTHLQLPLQIIKFERMKPAQRSAHHFPVLIEQDEDNVYIVSCPSFKGCHSYGKTIDEALTNLKEVLEMCLEEGQPKQLNQFIGFREIEFTF